MVSVGEVAERVLSVGANIAHREANRKRIGLAHAPRCRARSDPIQRTGHALTDRDLPRSDDECLNRIGRVEGFHGLFIAAKLSAIVS